jgi:sulfur-oxidizing protein SoxY
MMKLSKLNRRMFLRLGVLLGTWPPLSAHAKPEEAQAEIQKITQNKPLQNGRVHIEMPQLVDNGNLVVLSVLVDSPMTKTNHVKEIHMIAEGNPLPRIYSAYMDERAGKAAFTIRVRLADSQTIWCIAVMNDGSLWYQTAQTIVTSSACTENLV